ncbi:MAG: PleD family two-component system response regulator [Planctomycetota bacterium]|jgi:CheY-like chemotaxis protein
MARVLLIHWNADEARERLQRLRSAGHTATAYSEQGGAGLQKFRDRPPAAVVIDLSRLPSHGRAVATWLRQQKATRQVPIVFVDGDREKVARTKKALPDAVYASWRGIRGALARALAKPPTKPVVPGTMADYSGTPLPKKLGIRAGSVVALLGAPARFEKTLGKLPADVTLRRQARGKADLVMLFTKSRADLDRRLAAAKRTIADRGSLWIAWPKQASGVASDLTQQLVRKTGLAAGLVDYKICAIDATWSGLRFARRSK